MNKSILFFLLFCAPAAAQFGGSNAKKLQGTEVCAGINPSDTQVLTWSASSGCWGAGNGGGGGSSPVSCSGGVCTLPGGDTFSLTSLTVSGTLSVGTTLSAGGYNLGLLARPAAPSVTATCTGTCATTWSYCTVANYADGSHSACSVSASTATGAATLTGANYISVTPASVATATSCDIWRAAAGTSPTTLGKLAGGPYTCGVAVQDTGLVGDGTNLPGNTQGMVLYPSAAVPVYLHTTNNRAGFDDTECSTRSGSSLGTCNLFLGLGAGESTRNGLSGPLPTDPNDQAHNQLGSHNTGVGLEALQSVTTGWDNAAFGMWTLLSNTTGIGNSAFGAGPLVSNTTGNNNTALGNNAMTQNLVGFQNTAVGWTAGLNILSNNNTCVGAAACTTLRNAAGNTAVGQNALSNAQDEDQNTAVGISSFAAYTGQYGISLGAYSGQYETTGDGVFMVDSYFRSNQADQRTKAFLYGQIAPGGTGHWLNLNGKMEAQTFQLSVIGNVAVAVAQPTCNAASAGTLWYSGHTTGVKDSAAICAADATDTYNWRTIY